MSPEKTAEPRCKQEGHLESRNFEINFYLMIATFKNYSSNFKIMSK